MDAKVAAGWQIKSPPVFFPGKGGALPVILEELWRPFREHAKAVGAGDPISGIESAGTGSRVIPEGAGPVNPLLLQLIFLFAVLRLFVGASR